MVKRLKILRLYCFALWRGLLIGHPIKMFRAIRQIDLLVTPLWGLDDVRFIIMDSSVKEYIRENSKT